MKSLTLSTLALTFLSACVSAPIETAIPALIIPSAEATQLLSAAMSSALNGRKVLLNRNAFTQSNTHTLHQKPAMTRDGQLIDGRMLTRPQSNHFALFMRGSSCYLIHERTSAQYPLQGLHCRPL